MTSEIDLPFWGRATLAAAAGALIGMITALAGRHASIETLLYAAVPAVAALNVFLGDLGRRRFSLAVTAGTALGSLILVGCLGPNGMAFATMLLGGIVGGRLAREGTHREARQTILFLAGGIIFPLATIAAYRLVVASAPGEPLAVGLAVLHLLFWVPAGGAEAVLARHAGRKRFPEEPQFSGPAAAEEAGRDS